MKTKLLTLLILCLSVFVSAQEFIGKAIYKTSRKSNFKIDGAKSNMSESQIKEIEERMRKMNQKTFILEFDKSTSIYKQEAKLNVPQPKKGGITMFGGNSTDVYYKDIKEKKFVNKTNIMGKGFLIKDVLPKYNWQLTAETKHIGNYTCYKATISKEVDKKSMEVVDGKLENVTKKVTVLTTAWYTTQIPVSNGPSTYYGLPGLILEINDGTTTMVCTEIILNPTDEIKIEAPEKGKVVNQEEYNKISAQKEKEMLERFRSRDGKGINITIQG
ncbi:GLPGLI family protein [Polaribacter sargassicola]|uniref:GLPGLI family protein n=1 Tax=Polaribacter sargassicola TaxID=2836891 RepID=UPI001F165C02|nr:GLPGLI family protein [Polaribacter sp. DS7-9]MCG1036090.1 GLPGLI family protein [Polaribacter sp. DS7-9]